MEECSLLHFCVSSRGLEKEREGESRKHRKRWHRHTRTPIQKSVGFIRTLCVFLYFLFFSFSFSFLKKKCSAWSPNLFGITISFGIGSSTHSVHLFIPFTVLHLHLHLRLEDNTWEMDVDSLFLLSSVVFFFYLFLTVCACKPLQWCWF